MLFQSRELLFRSRKMPFGWLEGVAESRGGSFSGQFLVAFSLLFWLCGFWFSNFLLLLSLAFRPVFVCSLFLAGGSQALMDCCLARSGVAEASFVKPL